MARVAFLFSILGASFARSKICDVCNRHRKATELMRKPALQRLALWDSLDSDDDWILDLPAAVGMPLRSCSVRLPYFYLFYSIFYLFSFALCFIPSSLLSLL
jgi:hypothetical protein